MVVREEDFSCYRSLLELLMSFYLMSPVSIYVTQLIKFVFLHRSIYHPTLSSPFLSSLYSSLYNFPLFFLSFNPKRSHSLTLSLSLSLTHTHSLTPEHKHILSTSLTHAHNLSLSLSHSLTHSLIKNTLSLSYFFYLR